MLSSRILIVAMVLGCCGLVVGQTFADKKRTLRVKLDVPATNYRMNIHQIYLAGNEIWVVARVKMVGDAGGGAITTLTDSVTVPAPDGKVRTFILGKNWNWEEPKHYEYVSDKALSALKKKQQKKGKLKELYLRNKDAD